MRTKITLYTEDYCPFCRQAKSLLQSKGISDWTEIDIGDQPEKRPEMIERANGGFTVPQIFVDGRHIGGSDDLAALDASGELDVLLAAKNTG